MAFKDDPHPGHRTPHAPEQITEAAHLGRSQAVPGSPTSAIGPLQIIAKHEQFATCKHGGMRSRVPSDELLGDQCKSAVRLKIGSIGLNLGNRPDDCTLGRDPESFIIQL